MLRRILTVAIALGIGVAITSSLPGCKSDEDKAKDAAGDAAEKAADKAGD